MRIPVPIPGHAHSPEDGIDTRTSVRFGDAIEAESDVLSDRQMGKESVVLKDETDPPPFRRPVERRVCAEDRKSVVEGKSVSVRVDLVVRRIIKKKKTAQILAKQKNYYRT